MWVGIASSLVDVLDIVAILIILNNWVSQEQYGIATLVVWLFPLLDQVTDLGLSAAVIQREEHDGAKISTVLWINLQASLAVFAVLCGIAPIAALIYEHDIVGWMLVAYGSKLLTKTAHFNRARCDIRRDVLREVHGVDRDGAAASCEGDRRSDADWD